MTFARTPTYDFNGQVALVTGASSGIGLAAALAFAQSGAAVVLADRNTDALHAATETLTAAGHRALAVDCDVADEAQAAAVARAVAEFGRLDMAYNNAGVLGPMGDVTDETAEGFDQINAVNLRGVWACTVIGLTKCAALDYAARGIRVNAICPGCIDTPMGDGIGPAAMQAFLRDQLIGRMGRADEIAAAVLWLCSPGASFVLGVALPVDGGFVAH